MKKLIMIMLALIVLSPFVYASNGSAYNTKCDIDNISVTNGNLLIKMDNYGCGLDPTGEIPWFALQVYNKSTNRVVNQTKTWFSATNNLVINDFKGLPNGVYEVRYLVYKDGRLATPTLGDVDSFSVSDNTMLNFGNNSAYNVRCDIDGIDQISWSMADVRFDTYGCADSYKQNDGNYKVLFNVVDNNTNEEIYQRVYTVGSENNAIQQFVGMLAGDYTIKYGVFAKGSVVPTPAEFNYFNMQNNLVIDTVLP